MQGRHTDRLITVCYLPVTLVMLLVMIHYNHRTNIALRISGGMAGFCVSMIAVPLVSMSFPACRSNLHAYLFGVLTETVPHATHTLYGAVWLANMSSAQ